MIWNSYPTIIWSMYRLVICMEIMLLIPVQNELEICHKERDNNFWNLLLVGEMSGHVKSYNNNNNASTEAKTQISILVGRKRLTIEKKNMAKPKKKVVVMGMATSIERVCVWGKIKSFCWWWLGFSDRQHMERGKPCGTPLWWLGREQDLGPLVFLSSPRELLADW